MTVSVKDSFNHVNLPVHTDFPAWYAPHKEDRIKGSDRLIRPSNIFRPTVMFFDNMGKMWEDC